MFKVRLSVGTKRVPGTTTEGESGKVFMGDQSMEVRAPQSDDGISEPGANRTEVPEEPGHPVGAEVPPGGLVDYGAMESPIDLQGIGGLDSSGVIELEDPTFPDTDCGEDPTKHNNSVADVEGKNKNEKSPRSKKGDVGSGRNESARKENIPAWQEQSKRDEDPKAKEDQEKNKIQDQNPESQKTNNRTRTEPLAHGAISLCPGEENTIDEKEVKYFKSQKVKGRGGRSRKGRGRGRGRGNSQNNGPHQHGRKNFKAKGHRTGNRSTNERKFYRNHNGSNPTNTANHQSQVANSNDPIRSVQKENFTHQNGKFQQKSKINYNNKAHQNNSKAHQNSKAPQNSKTQHSKEHQNSIAHQSSSVVKRPQGNVHEEAKKSLGPTATNATEERRSSGKVKVNESGGNGSSVNGPGSNDKVFHFTEKEFLGVLAAYDAFRESELSRIMKDRTLKKFIEKMKNKEASI